MENFIPPRNGGTLLRRTVTTALSCLDPRVRDDPVCRRHAVWARLAAPDRCCRFPVIWMDDSGQIRADRGFLAGYDGTRCRGKLLFQAGLTEDIVRTLAFRELMAAACAGNAASGIWIAGTDRDPAFLSDGESMRLCRGFLTGLAGCGPFPGALSGAPDRELGYLRSALGLTEPREVLPPETAAGISLARFAETALGGAGRPGLYGRTVSVRGSGPRAEAAARMARRLGARIRRSGESFPADVFFLCDPASPLDEAGARLLLTSDPAGIFEGCPLACTPEAARFLDRSGPLFAPACVAGGGAWLIRDASDVWDAERQLRTGMGALFRTLTALTAESLLRAGCTLALRRAAEERIRRGVV